MDSFTRLRGRLSISQLNQVPLCQFTFLNPAALCGLVALISTTALLGSFSIGVSAANADEYEIGFSTFLGGGDWEHARDVCVDESGNVFIVGGTQSTDFPTTEGAFQRQHDRSGKHVGSGGHCDAILTVLSADFSRLQFSSYFGGPSYDYGRACCLDPRGNLYLTGSTNGPGWPLRSAAQPQFAGGGGGKELCYEGGCYAGDVILMKLQKHPE